MGLADSRRVPAVRWVTGVGLLAGLAHVVAHRDLEQADDVALAGDDQLPPADVSTSHAIAIAAPPAAVWPWLVQMGVGRGGWYSIDWIDNLGRPSARTIDPSLQDLRVGDHLPLRPGDPRGFRVVALEPTRRLVLHAAIDAGPVAIETHWILEVSAIETGTRLISGLRMRAPNALSRALAAVVAGPPHVVMQGVQLRGIRDRVEALA